jgi:bla regulator protein blaR1
MIQWLYDTFVWTGALIALVLVLRRPVARHFGPQVAYALWALPLARFVLPPVVLPASLAPAGGPVAGSAVPVNGALAGTDWLTATVPALWLGGALLLLAFRARDYVRMRRELLADARPMGEAGSVRLVETPAVASPVAFGVRDKVVALPRGFMVQPDLAARDLAIAHELAHHRGRDLLANLAAQPLLALHWFNPIAWIGWRAMRSDQEAACDARVMAGRQRSERATYAHVIAGFALGPRLALAAPMACPVLGEKSIIHRLQSLSLADRSAARRKAGLSAIAGGALLVLPLTASISYAQPEVPVAPAEPLAAPAAPVPPDLPRAPARVTPATIATPDEPWIDGQTQAVAARSEGALIRPPETLRPAMDKVSQVEIASDGADIVLHRQPDLRIAGTQGQVLSSVPPPATFVYIRITLRLPADPAVPVAAPEPPEPLVPVCTSIIAPAADPDCREPVVGRTV